MFLAAKNRCTDKAVCAGDVPHVQVLSQNALAYSIREASAASNLCNDVSSVFFEDFANILHVFACATRQGTT
jgi:hypothetical protein